jgi:nitroreductase
MTTMPLPSSQLIDALQWRYATKTFDPARKIPAETWTALENSLVLSASSFGIQPYRFIVVNDRATRERLLPHAWGQAQIVDASHLVVFAARTSVTATEINGFIARIAATRGVPVESLDGYKGMMTGMLLSEGFQPLAPHWAARQAYIALGNLLTSAALLGVDACPMEGFAPAEFDRILDLPAQGLTAAVACTLGYRSSGDKYATLAKVRAPKAELFKTV